MKLTARDITGGESVYCINEVQLEKAYQMLDTEAERKIEVLLEQIQSDFDRNQQAALAFVLVDRLLKK